MRKSQNSHFSTAKQTATESVYNLYLKNLFPKSPNGGSCLKTGLMERNRDLSGTLTLKLKVFYYRNTVLKCKRNANEIRCFSFFVLAKIRRNFATTFRQSAREFSSSQTKFRCHLGEISYPLKRNFVLPKFRRSENSQLRNFHKAKFCWQWRRVVIKTFCSNRFKSLARVVYIV